MTIKKWTRHHTDRDRPIQQTASAILHSIHSITHLISAAKIGELSGNKQTLHATYSFLEYLAEDQLQFQTQSIDGNRCTITS